MTALEKQIEEQFGKIIKRFSILYHGWEEDGYGFVVCTPGQQRKLIFTNHSKPYEASISELRQKIFEYQQAIGETTSVIELLEKYNS